MSKKYKMYNTLHSDLIVFIFHFNRPGYLENAVASAQRNIFGAKIIVFDDGSDDSEAQKSLGRLRQEVEIVFPESRREMAKLSGGLHANMTSALHIARDRGFKMTLMLQDDMQVIRPFTDVDYSQILESFRRPSASFVVQSCFLKDNGRPREQSSSFTAVSNGIFERNSTEGDNRKHTAYSDTGFFNVRMFFEQCGALRPGEKSTEKFLEKEGLRLGFMGTPLTHWLPFPLTFSNRVRSANIRFADWLAGAGMYPIMDLDPLQVESIRSSRIGMPPYAEDVLTAPGLPSHDYWSLRGGKFNLIARGGWRRKIAKYLL